MTTETPEQKTCCSFCGEENSPEICLVGCNDSYICQACAENAISCFSAEHDRKERNAAIIGEQAQ